MKADPTISGEKASENADSKTQVEFEELKRTSTNPGNDTDFNWTFGKFLAILAFQLGYFTDVYITAGISAILSTINDDIGPNTSYAWMLTANIVTAACASPFLGRVGDIFGRRPVLLVANAVGVVGCAVSATAHNVNTVIGASVLIGLSSAMHQNAWACLGEIVPRKSRAMALGIFQSSLAPGSAFGALIAYAFVNAGSWRYAYWLPFALEALAFILIFFFYRPISQHILEEGATKWDQVKELDYIGLFLFVSGLVLFLLGLTFGGSKYKWVSAGTLAPIFIGFALLVACGFWEAYTKNPYALFPRKLLGDIRGFTVVTGVIFLIGMLYYSSGVLWPIQIQVLYATKPIIIGLYAIGLGLAGAMGAPIAGLIMSSTDQARWQFTVFTALLTIVSGCQAIVGPSTHISSTVLICLVGLFVGMGTIVSNTMIQLGSPHEYIGLAMGILTTARNVGGAVATTIYVSILDNNLKTHLGTNIGTALAKAGLPLQDVPAVAGALATGNLTSPALALASPSILEAGAYAIKVTYSNAFRIVYLVSIVFGFLGTIAAAFSVNVGHLMVGKVDIRLEEGAHIHGHHDHDTGGYIMHKDGEIERLEKSV